MPERDVIPPTGPPRSALAVFRRLVPRAEQDEVLEELIGEFHRRAAHRGRTAANIWIWRQAVGSLPALLRRGWWRGMTGFEPRANRARPGGPMFESWIIDSRFAVRRLLNRPMYAALAVLTIALGAGGTAAVYSIVRTLLLEPLPMVAESRVAVFWNQFDWSERELLFLRPDFPGFQKVAAWRPDDSTLESADAPLRLVTGVAVSSELFDVLGVRPMLGRTFEAGDDRQGAEATVILSHGLWRQLGSDAAIVGSQLRLSGRPRTVVGVMPPEFWFPAPTTQVWTSALLSPTNGSGQYALMAGCRTARRLMVWRGHCRTSPHG
jgi:putative ABC transport system permease protein